MDKKRLMELAGIGHLYEQENSYDGNWFYVPDKHGDVYRVDNVWYDLHDLLDKFGEDAEDEYVNNIVFGPEPVKLKKTPSGIYLAVSPRWYGPSKHDNVKKKDMDILVNNQWVQQK